MVGTGEQPPQAEILLDGSALRSGSPRTRVLVTIRAVAPPPLPPATRLNGNVYAIDVTAAGQPAHLRPGHAVVLLRATSAYIHPTMEEYTAGHWQRLIASPGYIRDSWGARVASPGEFALLTRGRAPPPPGVSWTPLLLAALLALAAVAAALALLRWSRAAR